MTALPSALLLALIAATCAGAPKAAAAGSPSPASEYASRLLLSLSGVAADLPQITAVAEATAPRLVAGGTLWIAGSHQGLISEGMGRAGGLITLKALGDPATQLRAGDALVVVTLDATSAADAALLQAATQAGALAVLLAPNAAPGAWLSLSPHAPVPGSDGLLPVASPALAAVLWTFTGELVGALTRLGRMPPMYQSVVVPGGRERNASHLELQWEPGPVTPVGPGLLGRKYMARLTARLRRLRATQLPGLAEAGRMAAEARALGHTAWYAGVGHMPPFEVGQAGDTGLLAPLTSSIEPGPVAEQIQPGDVVLYVGYYEPFGPWVETAHARGARIVTLVSGTPERPASEMGADLTLDACWPFGDALVDVPGYDVRILPPSGVMQSAAYWMLQAETRAAEVR
jgi:hypothetical protein